MRRAAPGQPRRVKSAGVPNSFSAAALRPCGRSQIPTSSSDGGQIGGGREFPDRRLTVRRAAPQRQAGGQVEQDQRAFFASATALVLRAPASPPDPADRAPALSFREHIRRSAFLQKQVSRGLRKKLTVSSHERNSKAGIRASVRNPGSRLVRSTEDVRAERILATCEIIAAFAPAARLPPPRRRCVPAFAQSAFAHRRHRPFLLGVQNQSAARRSQPPFHAFLKNIRSATCATVLRALLPVHA